jgi:hypothetical protein
MKSTHTNTTHRIAAGLVSRNMRFGMSASGAVNAEAFALAKGYVR